MKFKEYTNKTSMRKKNSRMLQGGTTEVYKDRLGWYEKRTDVPKDQYDDIVFTITKKYEYKPWLVAQIFLDRADLEWLVLEYNDIVDIMQEFVVGRVINIPSRSRTNFSIITKPTLSTKL
jgi:hypothetical protein